MTSDQKFFVFIFVLIGLLPLWLAFRSIRDGEINGLVKKISLKKSLIPIDVNYSQFRISQLNKPGDFWLGIGVYFFLGLPGFPWVSL